MARHRSPRGRAHRRQGAHRSSSLPIPLRGAAVAAVTGGALSLVTATLPSAPVDQGAAALRLTSQNPGDRGHAGDDEDSDDDRRPSVEPVHFDDSDEDDHDRSDDALESARRAVDQADKARSRAEAARKAREDDEEDRAGCAGLKTAGLGAVKPWVREAAGVLGCRFGKPTMYGVAGRGGPSDHPLGLAVDFMVDRVTGDALAQCALNNMQALGVKYVIYKQRINFGSGWQPMEDRGSITANHFDHVHVSFNNAAGHGDLKGC